MAIFRMRFALRWTWPEQQAGQIYLVPVRLEDCTLPPRLSDYHWVNLYEPNGYQRLMRALQQRAERLGVALPESSGPYKFVTKPRRRLSRAQLIAYGGTVVAIVTFFGVLLALANDFADVRARWFPGEVEPIDTIVAVDRSTPSNAPLSVIATTPAATQTNTPQPTQDATATSTLLPPAATNTVQLTPTSTQPPTATNTAQPTATSTSTPMPQGGDVRTLTLPDSNIEIPFIYVPTGDFTMGSDDGPSNEQPTRTIYLNAFWIMQTEVTNAQYALFIDDEGYGRVEFWSEDGWIRRQEDDIVEPEYWNDERFNKAAQPVVGVSWYEVEAYSSWLQAQLDGEFTLPTEAQWEKAARSADKRIYPWGDEFNGNLLNFCDQNCGSDWRDETINDEYQWTSPVGVFTGGASPYGALDMAGNVWEWTADWYGEDYYASSPMDNPTGPTNGVSRALRGGSFGINKSFVRSAYRLRRLPTYRNNLIGFRLVTPNP